MKTLKMLVAVFGASLFVGCGGGGSSSDPSITTPIEYDLRTYIDKSSFTINLEGTVNGVSTLATSYSEYIGNIDYLGTPLNVHESVLVINGVTETSYVGTYLGNIYAIEGSARNCYIAAGVIPTPIPTNATVGYVSDLVPLECTDGATAEVSFKLQTGGGDNALVVATTKLYINGQVLVSTSFNTVDPNMNLLAYKIQIGEIIYLEATSITQQ